MLKTIGLLALIALIALVMIVFTANNPGTIEVDLSFAKLATPIPVAFAIAFALGWLFGVFSIGIYALRLVNERRVLRRSLRISQGEVRSLRNLPLSDAD